MCCLSIPNANVRARLSASFKEKWNNFKRLMRSKERDKERKTHSWKHCMVCMSALVGFLDPSPPAPSLRHLSQPFMQSLVAYGSLLAFITFNWASQQYSASKAWLLIQWLTTVFYFCICACSAQLSMFHMEKRSRNALIIIIIMSTRATVLTLGPTRQIR